MAGRTILHIDMDAFYASVEQRDHPNYRGKPVVVGGQPPRGVVAAASYEARPFGIHSAMPSQQALDLCPHLIFVSPRFRVYRKIAKKIRAHFHEYTHLVEPLSLDEAYLDMSPQTSYIHAAKDIAKELKQKIKNTTGLTASAGVANNKFLAKYASDQDKPDGLTLIHPKENREVIADLPIEKFHGIGKKTAQKMYHYNIKTGYDLRQWALPDLAKIFGKKASHYYYIARGIDRRPVNPDRQRKSVGAETTFRHNLQDPHQMQVALKPIAEKVIARSKKAGVTGRTVTLKIKFSNFQQITRRTTQSQPVQQLSELFQTARYLLKHAPLEQRAVRLMGITLSNLIYKDHSPYQLPLSLPSE